MHIICIPEMRTSGHMHHPWSHACSYIEVFKTTPEMRTPPLIRTPEAVLRVSRIL